MLVSYRPSSKRILAEIGKPLLFLLLFSAGISFVHASGYELKLFDIPDVALSLFGAALTIFLGFRTNSAYDRWWEARKLWGALVNQSRTWARQVITLTQTPHSEMNADAGAFIDQMIRFQIAYANTLRCALRSESCSCDIARLLGDQWVAELVVEQNVPAAL